MQNKWPRIRSVYTVVQDRDCYFWGIIHTEIYFNNRSLQHAPPPNWQKGRKKKRLNRYMSRLGKRNAMQWVLEWGEDMSDGSMNKVSSKNNNFIQTLIVNNMTKKAQWKERNITRCRSSKSAWWRITITTWPLMRWTASANRIFTAHWTTSYWGVTTSRLCYSVIFFHFESTRRCMCPHVSLHVASHTETSPTPRIWACECWWRGDKSTRLLR